jgi:hypothetical protein
MSNSVTANDSFHANAWLVLKQDNIAQCLVSLKSRQYRSVLAAKSSVRCNVTRVGDEVADEQRVTAVRY